MVEASPYDDDGRPLALTVSIGVAAISPADSGFDHLLSRADQALYRAKAEGRNRVVLAATPTPSTQQG
jgi:diguanylate cyclase (GGDEF)-like protein